MLAYVTRFQSFLSKEIKRVDAILSLRILTSTQDPKYHLNRFRVDRQKRYENDVKTLVWTKNF